MANIYYLVPDAAKKNYSLLGLIKSIKRRSFRRYVASNILVRPKPIGGVKVIYQHCMLLKSMGVNAFPVRVGEYEGNFYGFDIKTKSLSEVESLMTDDDVVVIPEVLQHYNKKFLNQRKVIFIQNWRFLYENYPVENEIFKGSYSENGYDYIMCCGDYIKSLLKKEPVDRVCLIKNFIDHECFKEASAIRIKNRVLMMPRKNPEDLRRIVKGISDLPVDIVYAHKLTQDQLIIEYQKSDIFIATGYPEGFGLPPLEAMACGAVVIGFAGGGALEFMIHEETALVANDGDTEKVIEYVRQIVKDDGLKEKLRKSGLNISNKYNKEATKRQLKDFIELLAL